MNNPNAIIKHSLVCSKKCI